MLSLRGPQYQLEEEIKEIQVLTDADKVGVLTWNSVLSRSFFYPLFIACCGFFFHASTGTIDICEYALTIFKYPGVNISPNLLNILFNIPFIIGAFLAPLLMTRIGRRPQLVAGGICIAVVWFLLGAYHFFNLAEVHPVLAHSPVVLLMLYGFVASSSIAPVSYTLLGEVFPQHLKSLGGGLSLAFQFIVAFTWLKTFFYLRNWLGMEGVYWLHCSVGVLLVLFASFVLPETRNKTYTQLDQTFTKKNIADKSRVSPDSNANSQYGTVN